MEELQVIETTSGRQFKPWATKDDVQDPASVTAVASEIASGKQAIAAAINAKGGTAFVNESFTELSQDIVNLNKSFITYGVEVTEKIHWLRFICDAGIVPRLPLTAIDDDVVTGISTSYTFKYCSALESVKMTALTTISGGGAFYGCLALQEVEMPNLNIISGDNAFENCSALQDVNLLKLAIISGTRTFYGCSALQEVYLPNLTTISVVSTFQSCLSLQEVNLPNLVISSGGIIFAYASALRNVTLGTLTNLLEPFYDAKPNLRNLTIGQDTNINLPFQKWTATNVIAEGQSGIDELNTNLQTNLISKLYQGGGKILRLGAALYDVTTQETRDMVTAKGWTLQRG